MKNRTIKLTCPEDQIVKVARVVDNKLKEDYSRVFHHGLVELVLDEDLSGNDLRAFLGVLAHCGYENSFTMSLTALSSKLSLHRTELSKSVAKLVKKGYLKKEGYQGKVNHYLIDPRIVYRARNHNFTKVLDRWDDLPQAE